MANLRDRMRYLNPYDMHKLIINEYVLNRPGDTSLFKRDSSKDRNDYHVIKENHKFIWDENEATDSWEQQFAKRYYNKLFKEYCIADLTLYKENKIALRWRIEKEVILGKGQFICGNKKCSEELDLRTWEVNFSYKEKDMKKNALVKIRLCPDCSKKLNYHSKKREIKRLEKKAKKPGSKKARPTDACCSSSATSEVAGDDLVQQENAHLEIEATSAGDSTESPWDNHKPDEVKSREVEMEDYLQDMLL